MGLFRPSLVLTSCGGDSPTQGEPPLSCSGGVPLAVGSTISGELQPGDELDIDGAFLDRYALAVPTAATVRITMRSGEVDSFLWLLTFGASATIYLTNPGYRYIFMVVGEPPPKESNDGQKTQTPQDFDRRSPLLR